MRKKRSQSKNGLLCGFNEVLLPLPAEPMTASNSANSRSSNEQITDSSRKLHIAMAHLSIDLPENEWNDRTKEFWQQQQRARPTLRT